jgi:hypothetical protein
MKTGAIFAPLLASLLIACAPVARKETVTAADVDPLRREVVADVVNGLSDIYEPTGTVLVPARPLTGAFGSALLAALRAKGFVVRDAGAPGERFDCRVEPLEGNMYRVTTTVDKTLLSRLWVLDGATAYPGGAWARRE